MVANIVRMLIRITLAYLLFVAIATSLLPIGKDSYIPCDVHILHRPNCSYHKQYMYCFICTVVDNRSNSKVKLFSYQFRAELCVCVCALVQCAQFVARKRFKPTETDS